MKKPVVLIVDDSKPIICLLKVVLGKNFNVYAAQDGFGAMNWLLEGNRPDIVISDIQMPNIDGMELISYLTNSNYYEEIPVLVLSGMEEDEIMAKCEKLNVSGYISKPFDPAVLLEKINSTLNKSRTEQSSNGSFFSI